MPYTVLAAGAISIWRALETRGCDAPELFARAGLDPRRIEDPNARYPDKCVYRLWRLAVEATHDPLFGLKVAREWHPSGAHALGYAWLASSTLRDAFGRLVRYHRVLSDKERVSLDDGPTETCFVIDNPSSAHPTAPEDLDAYFATVVDLCRLSYGPNLTGLRISMTRSRPEGAEDFLAYFQSPVRFSSNTDTLCLSNGVLDARLPTGNTEVARANDIVVQGYLARFDRMNVGMQVRRQLTAQLSSGAASQESIANELHMSLRTLQRKLESEGTTFKRLLDETRKELAIQYMAESHHSVNEITYLLGFSEASNFSRAFKRWTGQSPSAYRAGLANSTPSI